MASPSLVAHKCMRSHKRPARNSEEFHPADLMPAGRRIQRALHRALVGAGLIRPDWEYVPGGWRPPAAAGWNDTSIVDAQRRKWPDFVAALQGPGLLGIGHEMARIATDDVGHHNTLMTFAYVLARAARGRPRLSVLDWGGGMGHYALIAHAVLPEVVIDYTVMDLPGLCAAGRAVLPAVTFEPDAEVCLGQTAGRPGGAQQLAAICRGLARAPAALGESRQRMGLRDPPAPRAAGGDLRRRAAAALGRLSH